MNICESNNSDDDGLVSSSLSFDGGDSSQNEQATTEKNVGNAKRDNQTTTLQPHLRLRCISRAILYCRLPGRQSMSYLRQFLYLPQQQVVLTHAFQKRLQLTTDNVVAILDLIIIMLSFIQLELSLSNPGWHEHDKNCLVDPQCINVTNQYLHKGDDRIRMSIIILTLVRVIIRVQWIWKNISRYHSRSITNKLRCILLYMLKSGFIIVLPFPMVESILPSSLSTLYLCLSIAVVIRPTLWKTAVYFPYPIRHKEAVSMYVDGLKFNYNQFVIKKVLEESPFYKILLVYSILISFLSYILHVVETFAKICIWDTKSLTCPTVSWQETLWWVLMDIIRIGTVETTPSTTFGRIILVFLACINMAGRATITCIVMSNFLYGSMEARVHNYLHRMELKNKTKQTAVRALQSSYRFNKIYERSIVWHQEIEKSFYYRPLSARLPNEVKKKLCLAKFTTVLHETSKYNLDSDPRTIFINKSETINHALTAAIKQIDTMMEETANNLQSLKKKRRKVMYTDQKLSNSRDINKIQKIKMTHSNEKANNGDSSFIVETTQPPSIEKDNCVRRVEIDRKSVEEISKPSSNQLSKTCDYKMGAVGKLQRKNTQKIYEMEWEKDLLKQCGDILSGLFKLEENMQKVSSSTN